MATNKSKRKAVFGIFRRESEILAAKNKLRAVGFSTSDITVLSSTKNEPLDIEQSQRTMILPFAKMGFYIGGSIFYLLGLIINSNMDDMLEPLQNIILLNQTFVLFFVSCFGLIFGAASGALVGIGTPQIVIKRLTNYVDSGGKLLSVYVDSVYKEQLAKVSLATIGARDVTLLTEREGWASVNKHRRSELTLPHEIS